MSAQSDRFAEAMARFDRLNSEDPHTVDTATESLPRALLYSRHMTDRLDRFVPNASEPLKLAARAQHLGRWKIQRNTFPEGRRGYLQWRSKLAAMHAELASEILITLGFDESFVVRTAALIQKLELKKDPEAQSLEDVACLVFLEHYFSEFASKHPEDKVKNIVKKTWRKMSASAQEAAMLIEYSPQDKALIAEALS